MFDIIYIAVFTVGFLDDYVFQRVDIVVQEGGLFFYFQRFFVPWSSFFGILTVEVGQFLVEDIVLQRSIRSRPFQSVFNLLESVEHIGLHVEGQHGSEDDILEV